MDDFQQDNAFDPAGDVATNAVAVEQTPSAADRSTWLPPQAKEIFRRLGPVGPLAVIAATLPAIGTFLILLALGKTNIAPWLHSQGGGGIALYIGAYALLSGLALCNTYAPSLVGGFAFGVRTGSVAAMASVCIAATFAYVLARRMAGDRVTGLIAEQPKWKAVHDALVGGSVAKTLTIIGLIRLSSSPFAMTNLVLGATRVNPVVYILGTLLGFAPRTIATVAIGARLSRWDQIHNASSKWLWVGGIVLTFIVLGIIGAIANKALHKVTQKEG